jgi:SAM-dependent methyltransferase
MYFAPDESTNLRREELAKYIDVWSNPDYRVANQGLQLWNAFRSLFGYPASALDIGCGNGRLFKAWNAEGIEGHGVDFAPNALDVDHPNRDRFTLQCLWDMRFDRTFELGLCADVMEHIPPSKVDAVLACIAKACDLVVFEIANYPSVYGDLHLSLHDADWWLAKLNEYGEAAYLPDVKRNGVREYVLTLKPRR